MKDVNPYGQETQQTPETHTQTQHSQIAETKDKESHKNHDREINKYYIQYNKTKDGCLIRTLEYRALWD